MYVCACVCVCVCVNDVGANSSSVVVGGILQCCAANRLPAEDNVLCSTCMDDFYEWGGMCVGMCMRTVCVMCVCMYVCMYMYIYVCMCLCVHVCMRIHVFVVVVCVCTRVVVVCVCTRCIVCVGTVTFVSLYSHMR